MTTSCARCVCRLNKDAYENGGWGRVLAGAWDRNGFPEEGPFPLRPEDVSTSQVLRWTGVWGSFPDGEGWQLLRTGSERGHGV